MKFFQNFTVKLAALFLTVCFGLTYENCIYGTENHPQIKFDSTGKIASVWLENDGFNNFIQGIYCDPSTISSQVPLEISNPGVFNATIPLLLRTAVGPLDPSGATAIAIYLGFDSSDIPVILASRATASSGWNTNPEVISLEDGSESPNTDYQVEISDDGMTIVVSWSASLPAGVVVRYAVSTDGGVSYSAPINAPSP